MSLSSREDGQALIARAQQWTTPVSVRDSPIMAAQLIRDLLALVETQRQELQRLAEENLGLAAAPDIPRTEVEARKVAITRMHAAEALVETQQKRIEDLSHSLVAAIERAIRAEALVETRTQELELAQGAILSQDEREMRAGERCGIPWVEHGCDWPDAVAEALVVRTQELEQANKDTKSAHELRRRCNESVMGGLKRIAKALEDDEPRDLGAVHILASLVEFVVAQRAKAEAALHERTQERDEAVRWVGTLRTVILQAQKTFERERAVQIERAFRAGFWSDCDNCDEAWAESRDAVLPSSGSQP